MSISSTAKSLLFAISVSITGTAYCADQLEVQNANGIDYVSGGVSESSQNAMLQIADQFNLHLTFAVNEGNYLAKVPVRISDNQGNTILETVSEGPLFYTTLTPGLYTITAIATDEERSRRVEITAEQAKALVFTW